MDIKEYQKAALTTAIFPASVKIIYPSWGLMGELGEFSNKIKKIIRDNNFRIDDDNRLHAMLELGDIMWYAVVLLNSVGLEPEKYNTTHRNISEGDATLISFETFSDLCDKCLSFTKAAKNYHSRPIILKRSFVELVCDVEILAGQLGYTLEQVMQANIDKLASRAKRGTIGGSGDDR